MSVEELSVSQHSNRRSFTSLIGRAVKRRRLQSDEELQQAALQLISHNHNLSDLILEAGSGAEVGREICEGAAGTEDVPDRNTVGKVGASLLESELRRQAGELGVPVGVLCVQVVMEKLTGLNLQGGGETAMIDSAQRAELAVLLQAVRELLCVFSPKLLWQQYWKTQPVLEVVYRLHTEEILPLQNLLHSEPAVCVWLVSQLQRLCGCGASDPEDQEVQRRILSAVVSVLVGSGFEDSVDSAVSRSCCSVLDRMLSWLLDSLGNTDPSQSDPPAASVWLQVFDPSLLGVSVSEETLRRFFTHSLTHILTHRPRLKVSDAISMQSKWSFTKTPRLLTDLYCKVCVVFSVEVLLAHLQQVLETREVNWQNVLSCISTLLVYQTHTHSCLRELLSRLLTSAFESYDVERMITAFLLARQGALEGPAVFPSYSDWFKVSFGGASGYHGNSKKSVVFLLKFLSDLVPFDPPQYLKVHVMYPPFVSVKHRSLLQEYVSLARTRLADLKVSVEEMGLYEVVSGAAAEDQPQCPAQQDVEKAIALFQSTGRISATVMEASIFRRPYFLSRFLPVLLTPRVLPEKPDTRMAFIEALRKAEKIPAALYSSYTESCLREQQVQRAGVCSSQEQEENPQILLQAQFQELRRLLSAGAAEGDVRAQLANISHSLHSLCADSPDEPTGHTVITLTLDQPPPPHTPAVVNVILQSFCQCVLEACRVSPPHRQGQWAGQFVKMLLGHTKIYTALLHRVLQLLQIQGPSLAAPHVLGLAVFLVELHVCRSSCSPVKLSSPHCVCVSPAEALSSVLPSSTKTHMDFSLRLCVCAVCYALCRSSSHTEDLSHFVPGRLYKQLMFLVPRLLPETRACVLAAERSVCGGEDEAAGVSVWASVTDPSVSVRSSARALWTHSAVRNLQERQEYQLSFSEWLLAELRVQRSVDTLTDTERQVYERWVCQQWFLPRCVSSGGCGGNTETACSHIINTLLDTSLQPVQGHSAPPHTDSCSTDILSRLQELLWELQFSRVQSRTEREEGHFLWELINQRCSAASDPSDPECVGSELELQRILHTCNRVVLAVPAAVLVRVSRVGGRRVLDCRSLMEHINNHQRRVCCPAGVLSCSLTTHFLTAVLSASAGCECPAEAVNAALSQIRLQCPLLLLSAGRWWGCVRPVLCSLWGRLVGGEEPALIQILNDCHQWASRSVGGLCADPSAPAALLAVCLHSELQGGDTERIKSQLMLSERNRQVLVFLLFLYITDFLSAQLSAQGEKSVNRAKDLSVHLLTLLADSSDWLSLFHQSGSGTEPSVWNEEQSTYRCVSMVTTDANIRLMPFAFYSVLSGVDECVMMRAAKAPGFLYTAVMSYAALLKLFLHGHTAAVSSETPQQVLSKAQQIVLKSVRLSPHSALTLSQRSQLEVECAELDPEVTAALSTLHPDDLSFDL
ncbi:Fanconi anemia group A protein homolog [Colossoma macropomum]|uniref:Fanconi anemia group A protein homolog n=1 Tax=Colossoma macropomum TaxID=42526 RepID=UPI0018643FE4|nr:Fanconi anemia group A protein homolog [Colossoma macropomum]